MTLVLDRILISLRPLHHRLVLVLTCLVLSVATLVLDYLFGPVVQFPMLYMLPVILAASYHEPVLAIAMGVLLPFSRIVFDWMGDPDWHRPFPWLNYEIRAVVLGLTGYLAHETAERVRTFRSQVRQLAGILSLCSYCKKIHLPSGKWQEIDQFLAHNTDVQISHGLCGECVRDHYPELLPAGPTS
jgi:K+-sensing histidine kinase KdpD